MTQHDDSFRFHDMLEHAREALKMIAGKEPSDLARDRMLELALVRLVEIIGEAASRVSEKGQANALGHSMATDYRDAQPTYPWL